MQYTQDQQNALSIIKDWWNTFNREQILNISGSAGCVDKDTKIKVRLKSKKGKHNLIEIIKYKDMQG